MPVYLEIVSYHSNFKKGDATKAINYRPISMLPNTLILLKQILSYYLSFYLRYNRYIYIYITQHQYGFAGISTGLQLISFYIHIEMHHRYMI